MKPKFTVNTSLFVNTWKYLWSIRAWCCLSLLGSSFSSLSSAFFWLIISCNLKGENTKIKQNVFTRHWIKITKWASNPATLPKALCHFTHTCVCSCTHMHILIHNFFFNFKPYCPYRTRSPSQSTQIRWNSWKKRIWLMNKVLTIPHHLQKNRRGKNYSKRRKQLPRCSKIRCFNKGSKKQWVGQMVWALQQQELGSLVLPSSYSTCVKEQTTIIPGPSKMAWKLISQVATRTLGESLFAQKPNTHGRIHLEANACPSPNISKVSCGRHFSPTHHAFERNPLFNPLQINHLKFELSF